MKYEIKNDGKGRIHIDFKKVIFIELDNESGSIDIYFIGTNSNPIILYYDTKEDAEESYENLVKLWELNDRGNS